MNACVDVSQCALAGPPQPTIDLNYRRIVDALASKMRGLFRTGVRTFSPSTMTVSSHLLESWGILHFDENRHRRRKRGPRYATAATLFQLVHARPSNNMHAVYLKQYGPPGVLEYGELAKPQPADGGVVIQVYAAGINPIDRRIRSGSLRYLLPAQFPLVLGFDVSGVVTDLGGAVSHVKPGDEVYCMLDQRHGKSQLRKRS